MQIAYYGHSCFGAEINEKHLLFDPFISPNELAKDVEPFLVSPGDSKKVKMFIPYIQSVEL